mmetsp:Transcript_27559/g.44111  ORF Transcript_27559/g.44111 Transcript_27559/m.44111 type:complete len:202 (+) Transcript_27559:2000-2605(+)
MKALDPPARRMAVVKRAMVRRRSARFGFLGLGFKAGSTIFAESFMSNGKTGGRSPLQPAPPLGALPQRVQVSAVGADCIRRWRLCGGVDAVGTLTKAAVCGAGANRFSAFLPLWLLVGLTMLNAAAAAALLVSSATILLRKQPREGVSARGVDPREESLSAASSAAEDGRPSKSCGRGSSGVSTPLRSEPMKSTVLWRFST